MNAIIDFFTSFIDVLVALIQRVVTMVTSTVWLITNLPQMIAGVTAGFTYAPDFIMPFLNASVAILVLFMVIKLL